MLYPFICVLVCVCACPMLLLCADAQDVVEDIRRINDLALHAPCTGMIILGGGLVKHHTCNANLMRNGADFSVFINTGQGMYVITYFYKRLNNSDYKV